MRKFIPIIIGLLIGVAAATGVVKYNENKVAYGAINWWDEVVASSESFQWKDIFSPAEKGQNLYTLVYKKQLVDAEEEALGEVAQKYGLTKEEAKSVVAGSLTPLLNNPLKRAAQLTQEDAYVLLKNLQDDFEFLREVYEVQKDMELEIAPSEIFANNELGDSGFDLVHDLAIIEEILFVDIIPNTVGKPFGNQLKKPYLPTATDAAVEGNYVPNEGASAVLDLTFNAGSDQKKGALQSGENSFKIGEKEIPLEVLEADVCKDESLLANALNDFNKENPSADSKSSDGADEDGDKENTTPDSTGNFNGFGDDDTSDNVDTKGKINPAPADKWLKEWCPGIVPSSPTSYFGKSGFSSLGNSSNPTLNGAAGAGIDTKGIKAQISICLSTKFVKKTVSSYQPGKGCVLCEVEEINDLMKKTLSHSLVPNKVAGNFLESAKCKDSYQTLLDMKFITIAAPIPTPSNDDIVYGKNIFEEWKKFTDRYQPLLFPKIDSVTKFELEQEDNGTQESVLGKVNESLLRGEAEALQVIEGTKAAENANNMAMYGNAVLGEMKLMTEFFKNYVTVYENIYSVCQDIKKKPNFD